MDHLILPEGAKPWMKLAYDSPESKRYENIPTKGYEYIDFHKRVGWDDGEVWARPKHNEDLLGGVVEAEEDRTREPGEVEWFFQTWLVFGLIVEIFALNGIHTSTSEFLAPITRTAVHKPQTARLVTTAKLPELIKQWRQKHRTSGDDDVFGKTMTLLNHVGKIVDYHCANRKDHRSIHQYGKVLWSVSDETTTAIIAVAFTLRKAAFSIYNKPDTVGRWPVTNSRLLYQRIQKKWCKSDAAMIMEDFDIDGQNYIAAATGKTLEELDGHYACTDHSCEAKIGDGTYETQHDPDCHEDDYEPEPKFVGHVFPEFASKSPESLREAIKHTIDAGHLPVLRWDAEKKGLVTYEHEKNTYSEEGPKCPPFVAISHVWADGKGNPFDNSLPYCQLSKLQSLVDDLCANHLPAKYAHSAPGFWMDTLCCIVGNSPEDRSYKKKSIQSMREIYGESVAVLIIDPWLMNIPSTASLSEICYRIYASGWSRRLWTHQEGFLAKDVYYQFADKPMRLPDVDELAREYEKKMAYQGFPITFPLQASGKTSFYYTTVKSIVNGIKEGRIPQDNKWMIYSHLASSLSYRSTTNIDDELLCVASVIGSSVANYASVEVEKSRQRTAELRMKAFLEEIGRFRQGIIFNNYKRLTIPGFRWAPASLLGHRASGLGDLDGDEKDSRIEDYSSLNLNDIHVEVSALNMKVNLNKYIPRSLGIDRRFMSVVMNDKTILLPTVGLPVDYPGYVIRFSAKVHGLTVNMAERRFGVSYSPLPVAGALFRPPAMPKTPSFGKVSSLSKTKLGSFGRSAPSKVVEEVEKAPVVAPAVEQAAEIISYKYVVFVAENEVEWAYDREYVLILQRPLGEANSPQEFLAMVGRKSVGPGKRYWVQSLCSAVMRAKRPSDDRKVDAGIDYVDVSQASTNWVVT
jgi:hypothetical protein